MDESKVHGESGGDASFAGRVTLVRRFDGARGVRVVHARNQLVEAHAHDAICITIPLVGAASEAFDGGTIQLCSLGGVAHAARAEHSDSIGDPGLETISIELEPGWLDAHGLSVAFDRTATWFGGRAVAAGRELARAWTAGAITEAAIASKTASFLHLISEREVLRRPRWMDALNEELGQGAAPTTEQLARRLALHPAWLAREFRRYTGEGLQAFARRLRVERAVALLSTADLSLAAIAAECGFCDQAHMNRNMKQVLFGRTPMEFKRERVAWHLAAREATSFGHSSSMQKSGYN